MSVHRTFFLVFMLFTANLWSVQAEESASGGAVPPPSNYSEAVMHVIAYLYSPRFMASGYDRPLIKEDFESLSTVLGFFPIGRQELEKMGFPYMNELEFRYLPETEDA